MSLALFSRSRDSDIPLLPLHTSQTQSSSPPPPHNRIAPLNRVMSSSEPLQALFRQSKHLQSHLQSLLDAQSEGLLAGLGGAGPTVDSASSTGTLTPTPSASDFGTRSFSKPPSIIPVRQPKPRKIGLRAARKGISRAITDLANMKADERQVLHDGISRRDGAIGEVDRLASNQADLRSEIDAIEAESTTAQINNLKSIERELSTEIHELETRLYEMKAKQKHMLREISNLENGVQSKLSSYKNALKLAEEEARAYLDRPPPDLDSSSTVGTKQGHDSVWALPKQRRTLDLVREHWLEEQKTLSEQVEQASSENNALEEGGKVWKDVIGEVGEVERLLQTEMGRLRSGGGETDAEHGMQTVLDRMGQAEKYLDERLSTAEQGNWKLLVVAIGTELEALVEGQDVLRNALGSVSTPADDSRVNGKGKAKLVQESPESDRGLNRTSTERSEDEDDGPRPELLISHDES